MTELMCKSLGGRKDHQRWLLDFTDKALHKNYKTIWRKIKKGLFKWASLRHGHKKEKTAESQNSEK